MGLCGIVQVVLQACGRGVRGGGPCHHGGPCQHLLLIIVVALTGAGVVIVIALGSWYFVRKGETREEILVQVHQLHLLLMLVSECFMSSQVAMNDLSWSMNETSHITADSNRVLVVGVPYTPDSTPGDDMKDISNPQNAVLNADEVAIADVDEPFKPGRAPTQIPEGGLGQFESTSTNSQSNPATTSPPNLFTRVPSGDPGTNWAQQDPPSYRSVFDTPRIEAQTRADTDLGGECRGAQ